MCVCDRRCFTTVKKRTTTGIQQRQEQKKKKKKDNKQNWQYQTYKKYVHQPRESEIKRERDQETKSCCIA
jgi:3-hydroxy-3-methylglutaryl CoA synthase